MSERPKLDRRFALSVASFAVVLPLLIFGFQNCSQFKVASAFSKLSASCGAKIQEVAPQIAKLISSTPPDCESPENYNCLIRQFSPDVENSERDSIACLASNSKTCVPLTTITFDTKSARNASFDVREFQPGGEYNRIESQCSHSVRYGNTALFVGLGDDLDSAFASAKAKCLASNLANNATSVGGTSGDAR